MDAQDVWVDDSASSLYNTHQRTPANGRWASAEKLLNQPAYNYAQVIGYNEARTPGRGSAIFLHVDQGAALRAACPCRPGRCSRSCGGSEPAPSSPSAERPEGRLDTSGRRRAEAAE